MAEQGQNTYKIVELVGSSKTGTDEAIRNAIAKAGESLHNLDWFEVREVRGNLQNGEIAWFQVKIGVGFRVDDSKADLP